MVLCWQQSGWAYSLDSLSSPSFLVTLLLFQIVPCAIEHRSKLYRYNTTLWYALNFMSQIYSMESPIDTTQAWTVWASYMSQLSGAYSFVQLSQVCCYGIVTRIHYCGHIWTIIKQSLYLVLLGSISLSLLLFAQSCTVWSCILVSCIPRSPFDCL